MSKCLRTTVAVGSLGVWSVVGILAMAANTMADEAYYSIPLVQLELTEGTLPIQGPTRDWAAWRRQRSMPSYVVLDGQGEAYVRYNVVWRRARNTEDTFESNRIVVRTAKRQEVTGRLYVPSSDAKKMVVLKFTIPGKLARPEARKLFYQDKLAHFENLLARNVPGGAWFRHQARSARLALGKTPNDNTARPRRFGPRRRANDLADTYAVFSGGRALSENLQLDRVLQPAKGGEETIELDSIRGITVQEIDWKPLIKGIQPELDPLAAKIPADQHVIFFPTFNAAVAMADEMARNGTPILQLAEPRSTNARTFEWYQQQMCLSITDIARLLGPAVARSVAVTGSDPYFRTGTDVAVLFETPNPTVLENLLMAQVDLAAAKVKGARPIHGQVKGLKYRGVRSADRSICCYVAKMKGLVVVTNSPYQLKRLASVAEDRTKSIASLDEYRFFRNRYPRGDKQETAFLFLSDATIRRWCGPRWRIATSRRTRDAAVLAELQASQLDRLVNRKVTPGPIYTDLPIAAKGELTLTPSGVRCSSVGSLAFLTPISEMPMKRVTKAEADTYERWRVRYQSNWRWVFDPIALRLGIHKKTLSADLTVMPLIWGTDYRTFVSISQGAKIKPNAGDPHDTLAHVILAINTKSEFLKRQANFARVLAGGIRVDPIGWLGQSVSVYVDDDPFWNELAQVKPDERYEFFKNKGWRFPVAVRAEVSSGLKLTVFLAAVRGFIEQSSPGMLNWEALTYKQQPYVRITPTERAKGRSDEIENLAVYYSASGKSLVVTLSKKVLQHSIDRELARTKAESQDKELPAARRPWLGTNMGLQADRKILQVLAELGRREYQTAMQRRAWGNLPILNAWKHRYPDRDPVELHQRFWRIRLICPGGGEYVWNEQWQTMESTVHGCPAAPKDGPAAPPLLSAIRGGNFGITFEDQGLRARVSLER